jgi:hypothetical protein
VEQNSSMISVTSRFLSSSGTAEMKFLTSGIELRNQMEFLGASRHHRAVACGCLLS